MTKGSRPMRPALALTAFLGLAACLSPLERCVQQATESLRAAETELAELQATLARGYALEKRIVTYPVYTTCVNHGDDQIYPCFRDVARTVTKRVPVNLDVVQRRAEELRRVIPELRPAAEAGAAQCRAAYPEEA